jgi:hypothetical protein
MPALNGDTTSSASSCATTTSKINGQAFPTSATVVGSNASAQPVAATTTGTGTTVVLSSSPSLSSPSLGTTAQTSTYTSNGSTVNLLEVLTTVSNASRATDAATSTTSGVVGIAQATVTAGNPVELAVSGKASCAFDGTAVTAGDYVQISSTTAGKCYDAGATAPTTGQIIGFALTSGSASTTQTIRLFDAAVQPGTGTVTHTAGNLTSGQLIVGNGSNDIKVSDLSGDVTTSGSTATTVGKINGGAVPASATVLGSNSSSQPVAATTTGSGSVVLGTSPSLGAVTK